MSEQLCGFCLSTCDPKPNCNGQLCKMMCQLLTDFFSATGIIYARTAVYVPFIRDFLAAQSVRTGCVSRESFDALTIRSFILDHSLNRTQEYTRLLCTSLRSFFRFLVPCGPTSRDLSDAVPMVRKYRHAVMPAFLSPDEV